MKQHRREYLISRIRSGINVIRKRGLTLFVYAPTFKQSLESNLIFQDAYQKADDEGLMDQEEMLHWMIDQGLWKEEDDKQIEGIKKDIETLRVKMFENRHKTDIRESARRYLRAAEKAMSKKLAQKNAFAENTCEGVAKMEQYRWLIKNCTFRDGYPYDFEEVSLDEAVAFNQSNFLPESEIRELARSEPWRSTWSVREHGFSLFDNEDRDLTIDQKNLAIWSVMYDNINESPDSPDDSVIEDDDVLDGWFIVQRRKREQEKKKNAFESGQANPKIAGAGEVFMMAGNKEDAESIESMNSIQAAMTKKQRLAQLKSSEGNVLDQNFGDSQLKLQQMSNQMYKDKFKR